MTTVGQTGARRWRRAGGLVGLVSVAALALACTGEPSTTATGTSTVPSAPTGTGAPGAPGIPIPPPTTTASTTAPVVTTPEGGPAVVEWSAPDTFLCMADGVQAQVTVGWSVPSATDVTVLLDGTSPPVGIQAAAPYQVPAGKAPGVGSTIVFPCDPTVEHTVTITWAMGAATTERTFSITKAEAPA